MVAYNIKVLANYAEEYYMFNIMEAPMTTERQSGMYALILELAQHGVAIAANEDRTIIVAAPTESIGKILNALPGEFTVIHDGSVEIDNIQ